MKRNKSTTGVCPRCFRETTIELFPAAFRAQEVVLHAAEIPAEGDASCFEHAGKKAASVCSQCGRFVCNLCEVEMKGKIWCPVCLLDKSAPAADALVRSRPLYDSIALAAATLPMLLFIYPSMLTWPIPVYLGIRHWTTPSSLVPRNKWRFVVALSVAGLQMLLLLALIGVGIWSLHIRNTQIRAAQP